MAIVSKCNYDARGRLQRPTSGGYGLPMFDGEQRLTMDRGYVHVHSLHAGGMDAGQAKSRANAKLRRFFDEVEFTTGYRKLDVIKLGGPTPCNGQYSVTYQVVYAIENRLARPALVH